MFICDRMLRVAITATAIVLVPAPDAKGQAPGKMRITLAEAQAAALKGRAGTLGRLTMDAARFHRQAAQADYFPKIGSSFANVHFNKFMGQQIQVAGRSASLPLLDRDLTIVSVMATQPITPLFKVRQAVAIARADERIAQAKVAAGAAQIASEVEKAYFGLLIAQKHQAEAGAKVAAISASGQQPVADAMKDLSTANTEVTDLTQSFTVLVGLPAGSQVELVAPPPIAGTMPTPQETELAISRNPEVVEAAQTVEKARAAVRVSKLEYVPDVAILGGYTYQNAIPLLPRDFSYIGVIATFNVFDFGKRERTLSERKTQLKMAEVNLEMTRSKVAAAFQKSVTDVQRTRRIAELTRQVASMSAVRPAADPNTTKSEVEMFQAELDYRAAYAQLQQVVRR